VGWATCGKRRRAAEPGWKGKGGRREKEKCFQISKSTQANEFNQRFEFKHSNQCISMYAIVNSYISLIN
jgi:hypothetical protein